ncbi:hypothetical protein BDZ94DRAFT_1171238 [Collybia nuda]|uniref:RNI-like protein n=1 Tax=Collybia nuda TaxID=64659 RepID=A0A9P6CBL4_9AGAR|nr:hypothetical protein BDZ94DRAFT_1171238 [Collybia nuda]
MFKPPHNQLRGGVRLGSKALLSSRAQINCLSGGLHSVRGAQEVISLITARRNVTSLILGHNSLGDDGCIVLFAFLQSAVGRKYHIAEIGINSNGIGDRGLLAISEYLVNNNSLRELFLQNNNFAGKPDTLATFIDAVNSSRLQSLSLANNLNLSDNFVKILLPGLTSPHLRELYLSALGLSPISIPYITAYLSTPSRCSNLHTFKCNANTLGARGVNAIIEAIENRNYMLQTVELYSNQLSSLDLASLSETDNEERDPNAWRSSDLHLRRVLDRNKYLKRETEEGALRLLKYARPLLLRCPPETSLSTLDVVPCSSSCVCIPPSHSPSEALESSLKTSTPSQYAALPTEIQHHILSFFAPTLSPAQRVRIYRYASDPNTLPQLLPCLPTRTAHPNFKPSSSKLSPNTPPGNTFCVPDPSTLAFDPGQNKKVWSFSDGGVGLGGGCAAGKCMGSHNSVLCHREQDRMRWLEVVGCTAYDAER